MQTTTERQQHITILIEQITEAAAKRHDAERALRVSEAGRNRENKEATENDQATFTEALRVIRHPECSQKTARRLMEQAVTAHRDVDETAQWWTREVANAERDLLKAEAALADLRGDLDEQTRVIEGADITGCAEDVAARAQRHGWHLRVETEESIDDIPPHEYVEAVEFQAPGECLELHAAVWPKTTN